MGPSEIGSVVIVNGYIPSSEAGCGTTFYTNNHYTPFFAQGISRVVSMCMRPPDDGTKQICTYIPLTAHMHVHYHLLPSLAFFCSNYIYNDNLKLNDINIRVYPIITVRLSTTNYTCVKASISWEKNHRYHSNYSKG